MALTVAPTPALRAPMVAAGPALFASLYAWIVVAATWRHPGAIGLNYNALGTDWMVFYGAVKAALSGHVALIFDGDRFTAYLNSAFAHHLSQPMPFRPWVYPPSFLLLLAPFSGLGFLGSYAAFQLATAALLVWALRVGTDRPRAAGFLALAVLISPASAVNVVDGQCAFLVAALLIFGFRLLEARPFAAGLVLGVLTFKPQFWVLIPIALLAARQWRAIFGAIVSGLVLVVASAAAFGLAAWVWWARTAVESYASPDPKWVEYGRIWGNSVYACAVLLGLPAKLASGLQSLSILASAAAVYLTFRSRLQPDAKLAVLLAATILAAPHSGAYDALILVVAAGLWLGRQDTAQPLWPWILALALWLIPALSPPAVVFLGRFSPLLIVALIVLIVARSRPMPPNAASGAVS
jgi:hypothetical protein